MGLSEKAAQVDGGFDSDHSNRKWVIAGISLRAPLKPINTTTLDIDRDQKEEEAETGAEAEDECTTTPTSVESRIPTILTCPPAPKKKRKPSSKCNNFRGVGVIREFFNPPDLETVFIRHVS
ncbi:cyclin-dependent protein kinase inhibitor SMR6-like [Arachis stenosperma]|uniref:cyclin-dependent protein kinase inhibitor SMR6-like n=1 Tax=Arachis stenosperma TaxID=217475 RepID=UPI0025ACD7EB|nr:cyclin-dependent protein kinase inhibitor SMR6-like [Arachis stenosperma]